MKKIDIKILYIAADYTNNEASKEKNPFPNQIIKRFWFCCFFHKIFKKGSREMRAI